MTPGSDYLESMKTGQPLHTTYPHCDWRVLHAPHECRYCDMRPLWQQARIDAKILFTGDPRNAELTEMALRSGRTRDEEGWAPCPGYLLRGERIKEWGGNRAKPEPEGEH